MLAAAAPTAAMEGRAARPGSDRALAKPMASGPATPSRAPKKQGPGRASEAEGEASPDEGSSPLRLARSKQLSSPASQHTARDQLYAAGDIELYEQYGMTSAEAQAYYAGQDGAQYDGQGGASSAKGALQGQSEQKQDITIKEDLYKTELCKKWMTTGSCRYAGKCRFAHGYEDLRVVVRHPLYKTSMCKSFEATGTCRYGSRCRFIHDETEEYLSQLPRGVATLNISNETDPSLFPRVPSAPANLSSFSPSSLHLSPASGPYSEFGADSGAQGSGSGFHYSQGQQQLPPQRTMSHQYLAHGSQHGAYGYPAGPASSRQGVGQGRGVHAASPGLSPSSRNVSSPGLSMPTHGSLRHMHELEHTHHLQHAQHLQRLQQQQQQQQEQQARTDHFAQQHPQLYQSQTRYGSASAVNLSNLSHQGHGFPSSVEDFRTMHQSAQETSPLAAHRHQRQGHMVAPHQHQAQQLHQTADWFGDDGMSSMFASFAPPLDARQIPVAVSSSSASAGMGRTSGGATGRFSNGQSAARGHGSPPPSPQSPPFTSRAAALSTSDADLKASASAVALSTLESPDSMRPISPPEGSQRDAFGNSLPSFEDMKSLALPPPQPSGAPLGSMSRSASQPVFNSDLARHSAAMGPGHLGSATGAFGSHGGLIGLADSGLGGLGAPSRSYEASLSLSGGAPDGAFDHGGYGYDHTADFDESAHSSHMFGHNSRDFGGLHSQMHQHQSGRQHRDQMRKAASVNELSSAAFFTSSGLGHAAAHGLAPSSSGFFLHSTQEGDEEQEEAFAGDGSVELARGGASAATPYGGSRQQQRHHSSGQDGAIFY